MKKLILIDHEPFTIRRCQVFGLDDLIKAGVDVEVWCASRYLYKGLKMADTISVPYLKEIKSLEDLHTLMDTVVIQKTVFILECFDNWTSRKLFKAISDYGCYTIRYDLYANSQLKKGEMYKWRRLFSSALPSIVKHRFAQLLNSLYKKAHHIGSYDRVLSSSALVFRTDCINHPDYEMFRWGKNERVVEGRYIVFVDQFFPYHPDLKYVCGVKHLPDGRAYQKTMCSFFDYLEKKYNIPVVVAAHPKSEYRGDEFGGRKIIKYRTSDLILFSEMVINHFSNSVSYQTLTDKPVVFVTTNGQERMPRFADGVRLVAGVLGKKRYNLDKVAYEDIPFTPIEKKYRDYYKYTFLTSTETENRRNREIIINLLNE